MFNKNLIFLLQIFVLVMICMPVSCDVSTNELRNSSPHQLIESLKEEVLQKEKELKKAEEVNKSFEKMLQLLNILGQVDLFLTDRTKDMIKKLAILIEADDGTFSNEFNRRHSEKM
ncbi:uncharacterized protein LOC126880675 [Diabrotica virgifera virgifera]|uniref:Mlp lipoprotein family protein n=2 Tax=Diabrotica virgifera virgifera TaxID=50390 RepID=A0ABM5JRX8_DIAVI|nr:uncharacterized protein LOC126880675 [Diabrotica virgifera virgifera]